MSLKTKVLTLFSITVASHALTVCADGGLSPVNAFGCDLYQQVRHRSGNLCISPVSVFATLSMAYGGAEGETAEEFAQVLHSPSVPGRFPLSRHLGAVRFDLACALFLQQGYPVKPTFIKHLKTGYGVTPFPVDFVNDSSAVRFRINNWVGKQTNGKIQNILTAPPETGTRLMLINAVYFKGNWKSQFKLSDTRKEPFFINGTDQILVPLMMQTGRFAYLATDGLQLLRLPYQGNAFSMLFILPDGKSADDFAHAEEKLSATSLAAWTSRMKVAEVVVRIPRFKFSWGSTILNPALEALGLKLAFTPKADFSGITEKPLYINKVIHQTYIEVNEMGTEATASTAASFLESLPPVFCADHPFLFLIQENNSGNILFLGRIMNPN